MRSSHCDALHLHLLPAVGPEDVKWQWHSMPWQDPGAAAASLLTAAALPPGAQGAQQAQQEGQQPLEQPKQEPEAGEDLAALQGWLGAGWQAAAASPGLAAEARDSQMLLEGAASSGAQAPADSTDAALRAWLAKAGPGARRSFQLAAGGGKRQRLELAWGPPAPACIATAVRGRLMQDRGIIRQAAMQVLEDAFNAAVGRGGGGAAGPGGARRGSATPQKPGGPRGAAGAPQPGHR